MRRTQRLIAAAILLSLTSALAGCGGGWGSDFDPSDLFNFLDTKKKLPGTREPVFPGGVPGMEQGVPKELYKSAVEQQERQDQAAAAAAAAPPATPPQAGAEAERTNGREGGKPGTRTVSSEQPAAGEEGSVTPHREHKKKVVHKRKPKPATQSAETQAEPAPAPASAQPVQSAQPAQPSPPPFPAPLPSGSFSHH